MRTNMVLTKRLHAISEQSRRLLLPARVTPSSFESYNHDDMMTAVNTTIHINNSY